MHPTRCLIFKKTARMIADRAPRFTALMPSHRILYLGSDHALLKFLSDALPDCLIVRCPDDYQGRLFLKSDIKYSLLLFDAGREGAELEGFARSLKHRAEAPAEVIKKPYDCGGLVNTIRRLLDS
jgi:hypothetical protein